MRLEKKLPEGWKLKAIREICTVVRGGSPRPKGDPKYFSKVKTPIHWISIGDLSKHSDGKYLRCTDEYLTSEGKERSRYLTKGTLVLTNSGTVGVPAFLGINGCIHDGFLAFLDISPSIDVNFLYYFFQGCQEEMIALAPKGTQANLNTSIVKEVMVPIPPLETQRKIVAILEKAEETKHLRTKSNGLTQKLLQNVFLEMFSESNPEYSSWPIVKIEELADLNRGSMRTGPFGSNLRHTEFVDAGIAVLGIDNVVGNSFQWVQRRFISPEKFETLKCYQVHPGDVLITIMGTIGRSCVVPQEIPISISTKHLAVITCNRRICDPTFLSSSFVLHPEIIHQLMATAKGAIMDGLNLGIIRSLKLHLPPLALQLEYKAMESRIRENQRVMNESASYVTGLISAFNQGVFSGEMVA